MGDKVGIWDMQRGIRALPRPPGRYRYTRFAGICLAILGAAIGVNHEGSARWVVWGSTAVVSLSIFIAGERGIRSWRAGFDADASPEETYQRAQLQKLNRGQVEYVLVAVACFIGVLFVPVNPLARFSIWVVVIWGIGFVFRLLRR